MSELIQKKSNRGGARPGAGRPKGTRNRVTVQDLLSAVEQRAGVNYEDLLIEDFLLARAGDDRHLAHKYHTLISSKLINTLTTVEVEDSESAIAAKQAAFAAALTEILGTATEE